MLYMSEMLLRIGDCQAAMFKQPSTPSQDSEDSEERLPNVPTDLAADELDNAHEAFNRRDIDAALLHAEKCLTLLPPLAHLNLRIKKRFFSMSVALTRL